MNHIRYIQHKDIDKQKWDSCISNAENSLIYAYTWWLDNISPGWHALVLNDYEAVMPLTWREKYGIYYLYQPFCTAALGVFNKSGIDISVADFLNAIPAAFKYWDIDLNEKNWIEDKEIAYERVNQMLNLSESYDSTSKKYSRLAKRTLNKAKENNLIVERGNKAELIVDLYKKEYQHWHVNKADDYAALVKCCEIAVEKKMAETYIAKSPGGEIFSFYIILKDDNFVYSLLGGSTAKGKQTGAFYFLTDIAISDNCDMGKIFRFEGSDEEGINFFNKQFGANAIKYLHVKQNKLPFPLNFFKR